MILNPNDNTPLDRYVKPVVDLLNDLPGIQTYASCNGHGDARMAYISFTCSSWQSLLLIKNAVYRIRYTNYLDIKFQLWLLDFTTSDNANDHLSMAIRYQNIREHEPHYNISQPVRFHTAKAWAALYNSLLAHSQSVDSRRA